MTKEEDDTLKSVDELVEEVEEELLIAVDQAKEETGDSSSASARKEVDEAMSSREDALDSAIASLKSWGKSVGSTLGEAWSAVGDWKEEGTPLRGCIKVAREGLEDARFKLRTHAELLDQNTRQRVGAMEKDLKTRFEELDKSGMISKVSGAGRQHPELVVGGVTLGVALPSTLFKRGLKNGALAFTLTAGIIYGGRGSNGISCPN